MANNVQLASDSFLSGSLAAGWSAIPTVSVCAVVSNQTRPNSLSTSAGQTWTGGSVFGSEQISELTFGTGYVNEAGNIINLVVRQQAGLSNRYEVDIGNSQFILYVVVSGTPTQLGITVTGLTLAAGDIWTLQAAGSCLSVYQNHTHRLTAADTTYTGGTPGYYQFSSTNLAHNTVASWRGYSNTQQTGVWNKRGVIIPATTNDLAGGDGTPGFGIQCHSQVLYEGNAQILSGTVYKMWVDNKYKVYYLESTDGIAWTRKAAAVLTGYVDSCVVKNGSTYWMFPQLTANEGVGIIAALNSSDGIVWTLQNANVMTLGGAGTWDSTNVTPFFSIIVEGGTFKALYLGYKTGATYFSVGLATSPDGTTWTKSGSNPVLSGGNFCGMVKSAGIYYSWLQTTAAGRNAGGPFFDPAASVRYQSTDLINWTNSTPSIQNSSMFGSLNTIIGYETISCAIDVGGVAYAYVGSSPGDATQPIIGQIELAVGPAPIASVVTQPENATALISTDNFTRANGGLGANWTTPTGGTALQIASNFAEPSTTGVVCAGVYTGASFNANQYSEFALHALSDAGLGAGGAEAIVRASTTAITYYELAIFSPAGTRDAACEIIRRVAGAGTILGPVATITPQVGDVFRLQVITGSDGFPTLFAFQNGFLIIQVQDQSATPITTGNPGILAYATAAVTSSQISSWAGGNSSVIPTYPSGGNAGAMRLRRRKRIYAIP